MGIFSFLQKLCHDIDQSMIKVPSERVLQYIQNNYCYDSSTGIISQRGKKSSYNAAVMNITIGRTEDDLRLVFQASTYQVAWYLHYQEWPKQLVDHIDGNRKNNSINKGVIFMLYETKKK